MTPAGESSLTISESSFRVSLYRLSDKSSILPPIREIEPVKLGVLMVMRSEFSKACSTGTSPSVLEATETAAPVVGGVTATPSSEIPSCWTC